MQVAATLLPAVQTHLADVLWFVGLELEADGSKVEPKKAYTALIQLLVQKKLMSDELLLSRLENDVLQDSGLIRDASDFHKKQVGPPATTANGRPVYTTRLSAPAAPLSRLPPDSLSSPSQVKMNTRQLYTQQKYNLFREETEGYSKLIAELSELPAATDYTSTRGCKSAAEVIQNLQSLIGYFDLDPNRVLDLVLEALEAVPSRVANRALVSLFNPKFIPHMIGFKFSLYSGRGAATPPESLYDMCSLLLSQVRPRLATSPWPSHAFSRLLSHVCALVLLLGQGSVSLEQVLPHLQPNPKAMVDLDTKRVQARLTEAKKKMQPSLTASGGGAADSAPSQVGSQRKGLMDFGSLDGDAAPSAPAAPAPAEGKDDEEELSSSSAFERLQPLALLRALLKLKEWRAAKLLMIELDSVDVAAYPPIAEALCGLLDWITAPAYAPLSPQATLFATASALSAPAGAAAASDAAEAEAMDVEAAAVVTDAPPVDDGAAAAGVNSTSLQPATTAAGAVIAAVPLLQRLGPYLHTEPLLVARMCRLCCAAFTSASAAEPPAQRVLDAIDMCIDAAILPALTVSSANPGLVHELWHLLEKRPYTARYRSYGVLHSKLKDADAHPELAMARAKTEEDTKRMMRRLSKENTKQYGRHLGKITHCVPSVVFDVMLGQIQSYDSLHTSLAHVACPPHQTSLGATWQVRQPHRAGGRHDEVPHPNVIRRTHFHRPFPPLESKEDAAQDGRPQRLPVDAGARSPHISPQLPTAPHISPHLPTSPHISTSLCGCSCDLRPHLSPPRVPNLPTPTDISHHISPLDD